MLEQLLTHLNNWFRVRDGVNGIHRGTYSIEGGGATLPFLQYGQYYRIRGSVFNDGLHVYGEERLKDEKFNGEIWALAIPSAVISLADEIDAWRAKNPETDKVSESFGGYSYTRGSSGLSGGAVSGWQGVFASRLNAYRRVHDD